MVRSPGFAGLRLPGLILALGICATVSAVAENACSIDQNRLDRGERSPFMICGEDLPKNFTLTGLDGSGVSVDYSQWVRKCSPDSKQRGVYLWLSADATAQPVSPNVLPWDELSPEEQQRSSRTMEVYAAMVERLDANNSDLMMSVRA